MRPLSVAVAGLGNVGREAVRLFRERKAGLSESLGAELRLVAVADRAAAREAKALRLPSTIARFSDPLEMARRIDADICVELLGGFDVPRSFALLALRRGRALVTANKRLLAYAWPELAQAAETPGARLAFEGSVAGGVPILRALELSLSGDRVLGLHGILNGTTNFILTRCEEGLSAAEALAEAQAAGFAEKDPSMDLSGRDAAQKLSVLAALSAGGWLKPESFPVQGIENVESTDVTFARERLGRTVRLIASLRLDERPGGPRAAASVAPTLIPLDHPLAAVRRQNNALLVRAASAGELMFSGAGAGAGPTASAVLGDLFVIARERLGGLPPPRMGAKKLELIPSGEAVSGYYLRLEVADRPGALARIAAALGREKVSIETIDQAAPRGATAPVRITTHPAPAGRFERARKRILALPGVSKHHAAMPILS